MKNANRELLDFIASSPTAFHAVESIKTVLLQNGYRELPEAESWELTPPGKVFVCRNGSSIIAMDLPKTDISGFMLFAAHSDAPCFKVKEQPQTDAAGLYTLLNVEKYGGVLCSTWMDRPLSVAGRAAVEEDGQIVLKLVNINRDLLLIPNVAIHMERTANETKSFNANVDMLPLFGPDKPQMSFRQLIARHLRVKEDAILSTDLFVYPRTPGVIWGEDGCYISSPRLDDLQCVFAGLKALTNAITENSAGVLCVFDNEEVGSATKQGAGSDFLDQTLRRVWAALDRREQDYTAALAGSFMISADNAHAVHPNHSEYADRNDRPTLNKGVVIKSHAGQKYTTDCLSAALFTQLCRRANVPVQRFTNRADLNGGSTLGNISDTRVSVSTVDIGLAQLAMHSSYETAGALDTGYLIAAAKTFFESCYRPLGGGRFAI